ncbi:uncharacterized protein K460DRAFT_350596 [Cucurbitaria berberidis CBS 394.84]|uniref:Uncharacterized protein n=1 Tax=Cucurbitaria berberidis CBS 394.84 TaxID=1168544 RepID=A0A9P4LDM9_9PLEO|nr:uncharacterized protein K460DRAFT_350596 [Cucurbitaria berberidis CBS 394.84]KAF1850552.1 hypothetical protein K460DRAFT_350596 [Cucurbitaria berberidis CBS 394.84]
MADLNTIIGIRDFTTKDRAFRLAASELRSFGDLVQRTYASFHRDARRVSLHFHFQQNTPCSPLQLLNEEEWDAGEYFVGGRIEFFAHFAERRSAQRVEEQDIRTGRVRTTPARPGDRRGSRAPVRGSMPPPPLLPGAQRNTTAPPPRSDMMRYQPFGGYGGRSMPPIHPLSYPPPFAVPPMGYPPFSPDPMLPRLGSRPPRRSDELQASNERRPRSDNHQRTASNTPSDITQQGPRRHFNSDSTTVYSLCSPMPYEHYGRRRYFSGPYVFIPYPPSPFRQRTPTARSARPFPGFQQPGGTVQTPTADAGRREPSIAQPNKAAQGSLLRTGSRQTVTGSRRRRQPLSESSLELDRLSSPTYEREDTAGPQDQAVPSRRSVSRSSVTSDGLFVSERSGPPDMEALGWDEEDVDLE